MVHSHSWQFEYIIFDWCITFYSEIESLKSSKLLKVFFLTNAEGTRNTAFRQSTVNLCNSQSFLFCQIALLNFFCCCFLTLNYLDGSGTKRRKLQEGLSFSCNKHSKSHCLFEHHFFGAIFLSFAKLQSFIQHFRNFWKKSKSFAFLFQKLRFSM